MIRNSQDEYEDERETNLAAVIACLTRQDPKAGANASELGNQLYELCFNKACIEISKRNYKQAISKLNETEGTLSELTCTWNFICPETNLDTSETLLRSTTVYPQSKIFSEHFFFEELCRKTLEEEGITDEEMDAELAIIKAQLAYANQMLGREDVASKMYPQVLKQW